MKRLTRSCLTLLATLLGYGAYSLLAVPLIEPAVSRATDSGDPGGAGEGTHLGGRTIDLSQYFPKDAWQNSRKCKVVETDQGVVLFQELTRTEEGNIKLAPVTLVVLPGEQKKKGEAAPPAGSKSARAIIMEAPEGAELISDGTMNLARLKLGGFVGGKLLGKITIRSPEGTPADRRLYLETEFIRIDERKIWTDAPVLFRFGESFGQGRRLVIWMQPKKTGTRSSSGMRSPFGELLSLELVRLDRLRITARSGSALPLGPPEPGKKSAAHQILEVACQGPFRFDFRSSTASFERNVRVWKSVAPAGPSPARTPLPAATKDQLTAQRLMLQFTERRASSPGKSPRSAKSAKAGSKPGGSQAGAAKTAKVGRPGKLSLQQGMSIKRLTATGAPVVLDAPSRRLYARAGRLEYHAADRRILLDHPEQVTLRYEALQVNARRLEYELHAEPRRLGRLWAQGPGRIEGHLETKKAVVSRRDSTALPGAAAGFEPLPPPHAQPGSTPLVAAGEAAEKPARVFGAAWSRLLQLEPQDGRHVFSLYDDAKFWIGPSGEEGSFRADRLHMYVLEKIRSATPRRTGRAERLPPIKPPMPRFDIVPDRMLAVGRVEFDSPQASGRTGEVTAFFRHDRVAAPPAPTERRTPPRLNAPRTQKQERQDSRKFDVAGGKIELQILMRGKRPPQLREMLIDGNVVVRQVRLDPKDKGPLRLTGQRVTLRSLGTQDNVAHLYGAPARIQVGVASIEGNHIQFDQQAGEVRIDGGGAMRLPGKRDARGNVPQTEIHWKRRLRFDGAEARFEGEVVANGVRADRRGQWMQFRGQAAVLRVHVTPAIDLRQPRAEGDFQVESLQFTGGVVLDNQTVDAQGRLQSREHLQMPEVTLNQRTGDLQVDGAGLVQTTRYSTDRWVRAPGAKTPQRKAGPPRLVFLSVRFADGVRGNYANRQVRFFGDVRAVYGPVARWNEQLDPDRRDGLGQQGVRLKCDQLLVTDVGTNAKPLVEVNAIGNAVAENERFHAQGYRISYTEAKSLLILEGQGLYNAQVKLYGRSRRSMVGQRIKFWTDTYDADVEAKSINLGGFGKPPRTRPQPLPGRRP